MPAPRSRVFFPGTMGELWADWNRNNEAELYAGSAGRLQRQTGRQFELPPVLIVADSVAELRKIDRTERFIEIGSMVTLNRILNLGKILPESLALALKSTATPLLRNVTTIGGIVCRNSTPEPLVASLVALDSRYELRTFTQTRRVPASQFAALTPSKMLAPMECLTCVRIPLESWDYTLCRDFSAKESGDNGNEFAVFLARIQKDILADVRVIFSGTTILRDRYGELALAGSRLPLDKRVCDNFVRLWREQLAADEGRSEFQKAKLLNFIEQAILYFAY